MKLKIGYDVGKVTFYAIVNNIADAYEYIKAIVSKENKTFLDEKKALSDYMENLVEFDSGEQGFYQDLLLKIEKIDEEVE